MMNMKNNLADYLFHQGTNYKTYDYLGAHLTKSDGVDGAVFRVWAPSADSVSLVGDFNRWEVGAMPMKKLDGGVWEVFLQGVKVYDAYKYAVTANGKTVLKADPYAFHAETTPANASKVYDLSGYEWGDEEFVKNRDDERYRHKPLNIYEVNLLSFKRKPDGNYYTYRELAGVLVDYVADMGYNCVEMMPITEYPYDGSWGYQVTGYFAVTSRLGTPKDFMYLVDAFHKKGIAVILDWVPAHFPKDEFGLYEFDGGPLYENHGWDRIEHKGWGTRIFDLGRTEVQSFLVSSACLFFERYHVDGLRVDAVASMLYLDYDKKPGEWIPNEFGDNKNLEAIAFIKKLNSAVRERFPYAIMIAEESTAYPKVTAPVEDGGLGFDYKWNMGWMNDTLSYVSTDPLFRRYEHNKLTFSLTYAFSEHFVLPISHDEVVHGKKSLLDKQFGEYDDKFAGVRALMGYMMSHPGKKLIFMGCEFGQYKEWDYREGLEFFLKKYPSHAKLAKFYKDINHFYLNNSAIHGDDDGWDGFEWIDPDDCNENVIAYKRKYRGRELVVAINFSGVPVNYRLGVEKGKYAVVFNSDKKLYGGKGLSAKRVYASTKSPCKNYSDSITLNLTDRSFVYLEKK